MNNTDLEALQLKLTSKLWSNLLFYIPKDIIDLDIIKKLGYIEYKDAFFDNSFASSSSISSKTFLASLEKSLSG